MTNSARRSQGQSGAARSSQEQPGEALGRKQQFYDDGFNLKLTNSARGSQGQSGTARSSQETKGAKTMKIRPSKNCIFRPRAARGPGAARGAKGNHENQTLQQAAIS